MCYRLSRDFGWTPHEVRELTPDEVLLWCDERMRTPTKFVSTRGAMELMTAARERRRAFVERELLAAGEASDEVPECGAWERLIEFVRRDGVAAAERDEIETGDVRHGDITSTRAVEWLRRIHDELRLLRVGSASSVGRVWRWE